MCKRLTYLAALVLVLGLVGSARADLVAHWALDEGAGTVAADSSGNGNDGGANTLVIRCNLRPVGFGAKHAGKSGNRRCVSPRRASHSIIIG